MAKTKKTNPIESDVIEEVVEVAPDEEVTEATTEIADSPVEEEVVVEKDASEQFVYAQLKAINKLNNPAKAKRLADRVLRNRKR